MTTEQPNSHIVALSKALREYHKAEDALAAVPSNENFARFITATHDFRTVFNTVSAGSAYASSCAALGVVLDTPVPEQ